MLRQAIGPKFYQNPRAVRLQSCKKFGGRKETRGNAYWTGLAGISILSPRVNLLKTRLCGSCVSRSLAGSVYRGALAILIR